MSNTPIQSHKMSPEQEAGNVLRQFEEALSAEFEEYYIANCPLPTPELRIQCFQEWSIRKMASYSMIIVQLATITQVVRDHSQ